MAVTEEARNHLFNKLREALGPQEAATMMELVPPVGWADRYATRADLEAALQAQTNRMIGWMVASNATLVAAVGLIVSLR